MKHLELYDFASSTYVRTARMVCEGKHVDYQLQPLEFRRESHRAVHPLAGEIMAVMTEPESGCGEP